MGGRLFVCRFRDDVVAVHSWAIGMGFSCWIFFLVCLLAIGMHSRKLVARWGLGFVGERREGI